MHPALDSSPTPALLSSGESLCINSLAEFTVATSDTDSVIVVASNVGTTATVCVRYTLSGGVVTPVAYNAEPLESSDVNTLRASKLGTTLVNVSNAQKIGGMVWCLQTSGKVALPTTPTSTEFSDLVGIIRGDPKRRTYSGPSLTTPRRWTTHVTDQSDYTEFTAIGASGEAGFEASVDNGGNSQKPMSTMLYYFPTTAASEGQTYNLAVHAQHFVRFALAGVPKSMQRTQPTASADAINRRRTDVEQHGSGHHGDSGLASRLSAGGDILAGFNKLAVGAAPWVRMGLAARRAAPLALGF